MPQYDYNCRVCGTPSTIEQSIHEDLSPPIHCGQLMDRVYYPTPVRFNAGGFYSTDH